MVMRKPQQLPKQDYPLINSAIKDLAQGIEGAEERFLRILFETPWMHKKFESLQRRPCNRGTPLDESEVVSILTDRVFECVELIKKGCIKDWVECSSAIERVAFDRTASYAKDIRQHHADCVPHQLSGASYEQDFPLLHPIPAPLDRRLSLLSERQQSVLGMKHIDNRSLAEIGREVIGVTRERVRQIIDEATNSVRAGMNSDKEAASLFIRLAGLMETMHHRPAATPLVHDISNLKWAAKPQVEQVLKGFYVNELGLDDLAEAHNKAHPVATATRLDMLQQLVDARPKLFTRLNRHFARAAEQWDAMRQRVEEMDATLMKPEELLRVCKLLKPQDANLLLGYFIDQRSAEALARETAVPLSVVHNKVKGMPLLIRGMGEEFQSAGQESAQWIAMIREQEQLRHLPFARIR